MSLSTFNNSTIDSNLGLSPDEIFEYTQKDSIKSSFREEVLKRKDLLEPISRFYAIVVTSGSLSFQNWTVIANQDNPLYSVYSRIEADKLMFHDTSISNVALQFLQSTVILSNVKFSNVSTLPTSHVGVILVLNYVEFEIDQISLSNSQAALMYASYSKGSIINTEIINSTSLFNLYLRSSEILKFERVHIEEVNSSTFGVIYLIDSKVGLASNIILRHANPIAMNIKDTQIDIMEMTIIEDSPAALHVKTSTIGMIDNLRVLN